MAEHSTRNRPECEASWAQAPERLVGKVVACPEYYCAKADVAVTWDAFGVPVYEPHIAVVKNGKPRGHLAICKGEDGKVEDCQCRAERAA